MLLFPYKADVDLNRWPIMTLAVCVICIWVFGRQAYSAHEYERSLKHYCNHEISRNEQLIFRYIADEDTKHYCQVLLEVREAPDSNLAILTVAQGAKPIPFYKNPADGVEYISNVLSGSYARFNRMVPKNLTDELDYDPKHPTLATMVSAAFSHGSWEHLISNLIFFFAFAASVEVITGYFYYLGFIVLSAIGTHAAYSYSVQGLEGAVPTVGLSGVVMATMAFLATVVPTLRIRCFFWFIVFFKIFRVPALAIVGLYIVQNIFDYANREPGDNINYVAHLSGAAIGIVAGLIYRLRNREYLQDLMPDI